MDNIISPNSDKLVQLNLSLSEKIITKIEKLGMAKPYPGSMGANLSDIYVELMEYQNLVDKWLSTNEKEKVAIGEIFIYMNTSLEHIEYHIKHVRRSLQRVIEYCYEEETKDKSG
jgi:hypothetical protein